MDFLDRCAEAEPEEAALLMALYNEGVRAAHSEDPSSTSYTYHWYELE